ncbi:MAG: hypothetical protein IJ234_11800 [Clostridia bacterium]|nr:hypothetical protein [Clostridia bacterium]
MKKLALLLLAFMLTVCFCLAEEEPTPTPEETQPFQPVETPAPNPFNPASNDGMTLRLNGEDFSLEYDPSPEFTNAENGYLQVSFYGERGADVYELYLIFPLTVEAGDDISTERQRSVGDDESGIMLFITRNGQEINAMATQYADGAFPPASTYSIQFAQITQTGNETFFSGTVQATLINVDETFGLIDGSQEIDGTFQFTWNSAQPKPNATTEPFKSHDSNEPQPAPSHLVMPADAQKI